MNVKLLRKVKKHILEEPKRLNMDFYGSAYCNDAPACGTVGCIAGWSALLSLAKIPEDRYERPALMKPEKAEAALEITHNQAERLFNEPWIVYGPRKQEGHLGWPVNFAKQYLEAETPEYRAKITAARIEHFIKTKGRE